MAESATRRLAGHSGATLQLRRQDGLSLVRKTAQEPDQNARLRAQCAKLRAAFAAGLPCPAVLQEGETDELYWFEMEYVPGETLANAIISGRQLDWARLAPALHGVIGHYQRSAGKDIPAAAFTAKLESIKAQSRTNPALTACQPAWGNALTHLQTLPWDGLPQSGCHGDLTLENIMLRADGEIVLLDFDVPEPASWMLDAGKLCQDLYGQWCLRHLATTQPEDAGLANAQMRLQRAAALLDGMLVNLLPGGAAQLRQLAAFHLLRTLPYVRSPAIGQFVAVKLQGLYGQR